MIEIWRFTVSIELKYIELATTWSTEASFFLAQVDEHSGAEWPKLARVTQVCHCCHF